MPHTAISPAVLYWGTPVVLITTVNEDGSFNIGPMSSAWWLGNICMLGLDHTSQTTANLLRTQQCVLNLPSDEMTPHVNGLARTTGTPVVPASKVQRGYRFEKDKFGISGLTHETSEFVAAPRIKECPVQMEAKLVKYHEILSGTLPQGQGFPLAIEVEILKTYVVDDLRLAGHENRIDPDAWRPMIMSFQNLYGLRGGQRDKSTLADIEEELYRPFATKQQ